MIAGGQSRQRAGRFTGTSGICTFFLVVGGCATAPPVPLSPEQRQALGEVRTQAVATLPATDFDVFATSRPIGALKGAAVGTGIGLGLTGIAWSVSDRSIFGSGGESAGIGILATAGLMLAGAIEGAFAAVPAETSARVEQSLQSCAARLPLGKALAGKLAQGFAPLDRSRMGGAILELSVDRLRAKCKEEPYAIALASHCAEPLELYIVLGASARITRAADRQELYRAHFEHAGAPRDASVLLDAGGDALSTEVTRTLDGLAADIEAWLR